MKACPYCKVVLKTDVGFKRHQCTRKTLIETVGEANLHRLHILFNFWLRYNRLATKDKTYDGFLKSPYFLPFSTLQVAIDTGNIGDAKEYLIWLSKNDIRVDNWADNSVMTRYRTYRDVEADGLDRVMDSMTKVSNYCLKHDQNIDTFFLTAPKAIIIDMITSGDIHPWFLFTSATQEGLFDRMGDESFRNLMRVINADYWIERIERDKETMNRIEKFYNEVEYVG